MKNKDEAQNNEKFALIESCRGSSDLLSYTGNYTLFDMEDYATKNQEQLIMHIKSILKPDEFNKLKRELMCRVPNTFFSFTARKYYELFRNSELKEFLKNISDKPKKIPMQLLNILFSKKNNHKRKAPKQMQREGNINLKKKQFVNDDDDDDNVPDKVKLGIKNEKIILIDPHKPRNEDSNVIEEHWPDEDSRMPIENQYEKIENEQISLTHSIKDKPGNKDSNVKEEHWPDEDSRMALENWFEKKKKNNYRERITLNYICIRAHQAYPCFTAQDVLQFRLPDDPHYRILAILQDKRDFTNSQKLKKEVEFALQFNMAVLDVQFSEVISSNGFVCEVQADGSFVKSEFFLKNIVSELVLPVLALYKWVKLNAFNNAVYPNKESSEKLQV